MVFILKWFPGLPRACARNFENGVLEPYGMHCKHDYHLYFCIHQQKHAYFADGTVLLQALFPSQPIHHPPEAERWPHPGHVRSHPGWPPSSCGHHPSVEARTPLPQGQTRWHRCQSDLDAVDKHRENTEQNCCYFIKQTLHYNTQ